MISIRDHRNGFLCIVLDYTLFCIDKEGNREIDKNASFLSYLAQTEDIKRHGEWYSFDLNDFVFKINRTQIAENNVRVNIIIFWQYGTQKQFIIANVFTPTLNKGDDFGTFPEAQVEYPIFSEDGFEFYMRSTVYNSFY